MTAKELFDKMISENEETTTTEMMVEFAKMHVKEALKKASDNAVLEKAFNYGSFNEQFAKFEKTNIKLYVKWENIGYEAVRIDVKSIIDSYDTDKIT